MNEKYYILHYPSSWGMGTNADTRLVSDSDIRRLIRIEVERKRRHEQKITEEDDDDIWLSYSRIDDRFTGTWNGEKFCDSSDIEEVVEDVIQKRLSTKSTYAPVNDLVLVPDGVPVIKTEKSFRDTIFRVCNQFGCVTDVIAGEGVFRRYILDLRNIDTLGDLEGGMCYDFLGYDMKNVLTTGLGYDRDSLIKNRQRAIEHLKKYYLKKDGTPRKKCSEDDIRFCMEDMKASQLTIKKFEALMPSEDKYNSYIYTTSSGNSFVDEIVQKESQKTEKTDHTLMAFENPIVFPEFGQIWNRKSDNHEYHTYSELFKTGDDVEWLTASLVNRFELPEECGEIMPFYALVPVFAGD